MKKIPKVPTITLKTQFKDSSINSLKGITTKASLSNKGNPINYKDTQDYSTGSIVSSEPKSNLTFKRPWTLIKDNKT